MAKEIEVLPTLTDEEIVTGAMGRRSFLVKTGTLVASTAVLLAAAACVSDATDVNTTDEADADAGTTDEADTDAADTADSDAGTTDEGDTDLNTTD